MGTFGVSDQLQGQPAVAARAAERGSYGTAPHPPYNVRMRFKARPLLCKQKWRHMIIGTSYASLCNEVKTDEFMQMMDIV